MKRGKAEQRIVDVTKGIPPLYHKLPNKEFDLHNAETLHWLIGQEAILDHVWNLVKQSGAIMFDRATGKWVGRDYKSSDKEAEKQCDSLSR